MFIGKNRFTRKAVIGASLGALAAVLSAGPAMAQIRDFQLGFQQPASPATARRPKPWVVSKVAAFSLPSSKANDSDWLYSR